MNEHRTAVSPPRVLRRTLQYIAAQGGYVGLWLCAILIVRAPERPSAADAAYWLVVCLMAGSMAITFLLAEPEKRRVAAGSVRRYMLMLGAAGVLGWLSAHGVKSFLD